MTDNAALFLFLSVAAAVVFSFISVVIWTSARTKEREAFYRSETIKKIAESSGADAALAFMREAERLSARKLRNGVRLGGLIVMAAGVGVMVFLRGMNPFESIYLAGVIPLMVGGALFAYSQFLSAKE